MRKYAVFTINKDEFGIEIERINIIERMLEIYKIPNTPEYVEGLTNLRGNVHTVFNLRKRFHLPCPEFTDETKVIIANAHDSVVGLIVDGVREIVKVEDDQFEPMPKELSNIRDRFLSGTVKIGERLILILDIDKVISEPDIPPEKPAKGSKGAKRSKPSGAKKQ
ncbi:MAG: chemotaxis protein CheW [Clostridiaceae bacterium]|nr:chemotaxis protein CheW [Clostridiaceae bacterium]